MSQDDYSFCWPRDWLAEDSNHVSLNTSIVIVMHNILTTNANIFSPSTSSVFSRCASSVATSTATSANGAGPARPSPLSTRVWKRGGRTQLTCLAFLSEPETSFFAIILKLETEIKITTSSRSEDMLKKLQAAGVGQRPTVFVGHSMGGLIIKKMLVNAQNSDDEERKKFAENTKGIVFYSTPHKGSEIANLNMITKYFFSPSVEVQELNTDYPLLLELNNYFKGFVEKFKTKVNSSDNALKGSFTMNIRKLKKTTIKRRIFAGYQLRGDLTDAAYGGEHDLRAAGELEPWCWRLLHRPLQPHGHLQTQQQEEHTV